MPQKCAGTRTEPPRSVPRPAAEHPADTAAASPPLEPPGEYSTFHGLLVRPNTGFVVRQSIAHSGTFVLPSTIAPAARSNRTAGASATGTFAVNRRLPATVLMSAVLIASLIVIGRPCSGPIASPRARRSS